MNHYIPQSISEYVEILFKHRRLFVRPFAAVLLMTAAAYPFLPRVYRSSSMILVEDEKLINPLIQGLAVEATLETRLRTLSAEILNWTNMSQLTRQVGLAEKITDQKEYEELIEGMKNRISIRMVSEKIIMISYEDKDPQLAWKVTSSLAENLTEKNRREKQEEAKSAIAFIEDQLRVYKEKLHGSESSFFLSKVNTDLAEAQKQRALIQDQIAQLERTVVTEVVREHDPQTQELRRELVQAESLLQQMEARGEKDNPLAGPLREKVANLNRRMRFLEDSKARTETSSANPVYQEAVRRLKELDLTISSLEKRKADLEKGKLSSTRVTEEELLAMERDKRVNEDIYQSLLMRLENAHISQRLDAHGYGRTFEIIDPARLPVRPVKPQPHVVAAVGLLAALAAGAGIVFIREYFDTSLRGAADAKSFFTIPFLAAIPSLRSPAEAASPGGLFRWVPRATEGEVGKPAGFLRKRLRRLSEFFRLPAPFPAVPARGGNVSPYVVTYHQPDSVPGEQYRLLRANLFSLNDGKPLQTILVVSALAGEGKTVTSGNLAVSMAQEMNQNILLMDCDLRRGSLAQAMGLPQEGGLTDILDDKITLDSALRDIGVPRLKVLTSGKTVSNPSRYVGLEKMGDLMKVLRSRFKFIIMDSPPFVNLADVPLLATHADGVLVVVKVGHTPRALVKNFVKAVEEAGKTRILGYVLNHARQHMPVYFQQYMGGAYSY